eukprot:CAMPEP_0194273164 /NCGR_PEP_ID=MMETSP0169-20130528/6557_1 /TAXON_ID=218684 /ORGANISM="Corethron pennatum, Strain L29A3" /LENGTH=218 /DNA_ID=CAMNT_0039016033 /DNA_START=96 /DNA_END=753 /DNA_ORIENTATION=-
MDIDAKHGPRRTFSAARASSVRDEVPQPDEVALLQKTAAALRRQADELELDVAPLRKAVNDILPIMPKVLEDSLWKIMFRVRPADDNRNCGRNVAGEVKLRLRGDGYTDILDAGGPVATGNGYIRKAWGWDIDLEPKDGKQYVVWSADATNMEDAGVPSGTRIYFNCRLDRSKEGYISLSDGKITIKEEVKSGYWGIFNSAGILAEFRVRGDFVSKPI